MKDTKIPLLRHVKLSLARVMQLIAEVAGATADALTEVQDSVEELQSGKVRAVLTDSKGNILVTSDGKALEANWTLKRE